MSTPSPASTGTPRSRPCVMAIGAHADDIELMLGGTLLKCRALGMDIVYVMSTNNMSGQNRAVRPDGSVKIWPEPPATMMRRRKRECADAARRLGTEPIHLDYLQRHYWAPDGSQVELGYGTPVPDGVPTDRPPILTAHEHPDCVRHLADLILEHQPLCLFTHPQSSRDLEHVATALLVIKAFREAADQGFRGDYLFPPDDRASLEDPELIAQRNFRSASPRTRIWDAFIGEGNARWETFVDISEVLDEKMELIGLHRCQMPTAQAPDFHARRWARHRGEICDCGAAEVFQWMRHWDEDLHRANPLIAELIRNTRHEEDLAPAPHACEAVEQGVQ